MSQSKIESLRSTNFVLGQFFFASFTFGIVVSWAWAAAAALRCHRSLIFGSKPPLLSVLFGVSLRRIVISRAWFDLGSVPFGEIVTLCSPDSVLRWWLILSVYVWGIGTRSGNSGSLFFENLNWRFQTHWFWRSVLSHNTFMIVWTRSWCCRPSIWRWSWTATKLNIGSCLLNFLKVIKGILARPRDTCLLHGGPIKSILVAKLSRSLVIEFSNVVNIVLSWPRNSYSMRLVIKLHGPIHGVLLWVFGNGFLLRFNYLLCQLTLERTSWRDFPWSLYL